VVVTTEEELRRLVSEGWRLIFVKRKGYYTIYNSKLRTSHYIPSHLKPVAEKLYKEQQVREKVRESQIRLLPYEVALLKSALRMARVGVRALLPDIANLSDDGLSALVLVNTALDLIEKVLSREGVKR
jgi:hypothetical protein